MLLIVVILMFEINQKNAKILPYQ